MSEALTTPPLADKLVDAFTRLAKADFTVRLPRNFRRDNDDVLAMFVNLIAEELDRLTKEREQSHKRLEADVKGFSELFLDLAAGNFGVRATRSGRGDPLDGLAFLFNNMVGEIAEAFAEIANQHTVLETILESMLDGVALLDQQGVVRRVNQPFATALGYPPTLLVGMRFADFVAEEEQELAKTLRDLVLVAPIRNRDTIFRKANGEHVSMAVNGSRHSDARGALLGIVLVARSVALPRTSARKQ